LKTLTLASKRKLVCSGSRFLKSIYLSIYLSVCLSVCLSIYVSMTRSPCGPWPLFQFLNPYTVGRTPWKGDQPVARPLPTHGINAHTDVHISSGIRTRDPSVRAGEDGSCLRPRGHRDRLLNIYLS
jgi:hypothetical protein